MDIKLQFFNIGLQLKPYEWQNFYQILAALIGSTVSIIGIWLTFRYQYKIFVAQNKKEEEVRKTSRIKRIKPTIFAKIILNNETTDKLADLNNYIPVYEYNVLQEFYEINKYEVNKKNSLLFQIEVSGDFPAKNIKFEGFQIDNIGRKNLSLGNKYEKSFFDEAINDSISRAPLNALPNTTNYIQVILHSKLLEEDMFRYYAEDLWFPEETQSLIDKGTQVTATFSYEDIDKNEYKDLEVKFFATLGKNSKNEIGIELTKTWPTKNVNAINFRNYFFEINKRKYEN